MKLTDMARVASKECAGCGKCCRDMGTSIVLDPYDTYILELALQKKFASMVDEEVEFHYEYGIFLPNLKMVEKTYSDGRIENSCTFLGEDGRCQIHDYRPGLCRLFPLARQYDGTDSFFFVQEDVCPAKNRTKVKIEKYIGIPDLDVYETYKIQWHNFLKRFAERIKDLDEDEQKRMNTFMIQMFYMASYAGDDFYMLFENRLKQMCSMLGME